MPRERVNRDREGHHFSRRVNGVPGGARSTTVVNDNLLGRERRREDWSQKRRNSRAGAADAVTPYSALSSNSDVADLTARQRKCPPRPSSPDCWTSRRPRVCLHTPSLISQCHTYGPPARAPRSPRCSTTSSRSAAASPLRTAVTPRSRSSTRNCGAKDVTGSFIATVVIEASLPLANVRAEPRRSREGISAAGSSAWWAADRASFATGPSETERVLLVGVSQHRVGVKPHALEDDVYTAVLSDASTPAPISLPPFHRVTRTRSGALT